MQAYRAPRAFDGEKMLPDGALVLVDDGRIVGVEAASLPAPAGSFVTEFSDATLLPGLIDSHVHLCADNSPNALDVVPTRTPDETGRDHRRFAATAPAGGCHRGPRPR